MPNPVNIGIGIVNRQLRQTVETFLADCPAVRVFSWDEETVGGFVPDILIIEDEACHQTSMVLTKLRQAYPATAIFVISANKDPEHIVRIMKAGGAEFLLAPVAKSQLVKAVAEVRHQLAATADGGRGAIYTFINSKGGAGSTVLSLNTALAFKRDKNARVALWDMNFQAGDSVVLLDVVPDATVVDVCRGIQRLDHAMLKNAMVQHKSGLELLAAPSHPDEQEAISASHVADILRVIGNLYQQVVIDCPSMAVNQGTAEAFTVSDKIFIVIDLSVPAVRNAFRLFTLVRQLGISEQKVEFVVNRFAERGMLSIEEAERNLTKKIYWLFPNSFAEVMSSINMGEPLVGSNPGGKLSQSILTFVKKIKEPELHKDIRSVQKRRLLGGLFAH